MADRAPASVPPCIDRMALVGRGPRAGGRLGLDASDTPDIVGVDHFALEQAVREPGGGYR